MKGMRWRVGVGSSIKKFEDPWLPGSHSFWPISPVNLSTHLVKDLIGDHGVWNDEIINRIFLPAKRELIKAIPLSLSSRVDEIIWHFD